MSFLKTRQHWSHPVIYIIWIVGVTLTSLNTQVATKCLAIESPFDGTMIGAKDGDTYLVKKDATVYTIRLHWGDCPEIAHNSKESDQPFGREALSYATHNYVNKKVHVVPKSYSYLRLVADVTVIENGVDVATDLVNHGYAMVDQRYHPSKEILAAEAKAKAEGKGLWNQKNPTTPWDWRNEQRPTRKQAGSPKSILDRAIGKARKAA